MPPKKGIDSIKKEDFENLQAVVESQQEVIEQLEGLISTVRQIADNNDSRLNELLERLSEEKVATTTEVNLAPITTIKEEEEDPDWGKCGEMSKHVSGMAGRKKGACKAIGCSSVVTSYCKRSFLLLEMEWSSMLKCIYCSAHKSAHEEKHHKVD